MSLPAGCSYRGQDHRSAYLAPTVAVFMVGRLWFEGFQSLATYLGLLSAGLAIALKEPVANFFGWADDIALAYPTRRFFDSAAEDQAGGSATPQGSGRGE